MFVEIFLLVMYWYVLWLIVDSLFFIECYFDYLIFVYILEYFYLFLGGYIFESDKLGFVFLVRYLKCDVK